MSIYGNLFTPQNHISLVESYIDNVFLEEVLNESKVNVKKELKELSKKEDPKVEDAIAILKKIEEINDPVERQKLMEDVNKAALSMIVNIPLVYGGLAVIAVLPSAAIPITIATSTMFTVTYFDYIFKINKLDKQFEKNVKIYKELLKAHAKAKKSLNKAEKLENEEEVKRLQKIINVIDDIKKKEKTILYQAELKQPDKEKFSVDESVVYEDFDYLVEFKGNEEKNNIFIQVLDDVDKMLKSRADIIDTLEDSCNKVFNMTKSVKAENIREAIEKVYQIDKQTANAITKIEGYYPNLTMRFIRSEVRKFNNKYSEITMNEKKKLAVKLQQYKKKMQDFGYKYEEESQIQKEWIKAIERMENDNIKSSYQLAKYAQNWYKMIIDYVNESIELINDIEKLLNVEKGQKSIIYKVLNIKSKKSKEE